MAHRNRPLDTLYRPEPFQHKAWREGYRRPLGKPVHRRKICADAQGCVVLWNCAGDSVPVIAVSKLHVPPQCHVECPIRDGAVAGISGAVRKELESEAREQGLDNVVFTGRQPKECMPDFLALMDACLVHLRKTDFFTTVMPSKIFEAAGMQRPIINGVGGFAAEFIDKAGAGINIEPENGVQLTDALIRLRDDGSLREKCGLSGYQYVAANFDRTKLARGYLAVIEAVTNNRTVFQ